MRDLARTLTAADLSLLVVALVILVSIASAANGITLTSPRVYFAMARDGVFFRRLGEVHDRFGTPAFAVAAGSAWAALLAATGTFEQLFTMVVFAGWAFYALGAGAAVVLAGAPAFWLWRRVSQREVQ